MDKKWVIEPGELFVENWLTKDYNGIIVLRVIASQVRPFEFGNHSSVTNLAAGSKATVKFGGTFHGVTVDDLFYFEDKYGRLHVLFKSFPEMRVYPQFIAGYPQIDYTAGEETILTGDLGYEWGYLKTPIEIMVPPRIHLNFTWYNDYGTETVTPFFKFWYDSLVVRYIKDPEIIYQILQKKYRPEPKWFTIYGFRRFPYNFRENLGITQPIPVDATPDEIRRIVAEWGV
ncbi:MAG: hypothetical protein DRO23_12140 [Thermoprotei archaeon]|nr:MAG: hypothetical protein DRO23_12140 [Thermoprotei archaeon]